MNYENEWDDENGDDDGKDDKNKMNGMHDTGVTKEIKDGKIETF